MRGSRGNEVSEIRHLNSHQSLSQIGRQREPKCLKVLEKPQHVGPARSYNRPVSCYDQPVTPSADEGVGNRTEFPAQ